MSILIKGMEMPKKKNGAVLIIYPDGRCAFEDGKEYKAVPVPPQGKWIPSEDDSKVFGCSECHEIVYGTPNYCPHCGAKMDLLN